MANLIGTYTLFKRETQRFLKVYKQTIIAPVMSNLLFLAIFGLSVRRSVDGLGDLTYMEFLVPGLILMGIVNNAFQNPSSSLIIMRYQGLIENLMTIPIKASEKLIGFVASAVLRGLLVGTVTYLTAIFFVDLAYTSIPIIMATAILVALFFAFLGVIVGIWANEMDKVAAIQTFVLMPMTFLGGVFYSIQALPSFFGTISKFNPIVYMINLLRYGFTGYQEFSILLSFGVVGTVTIVAGIISYLMLRSGYRLQD